MDLRTQEQDDITLPAHRYEADGLIILRASLETIFILTPVPTIVLDSSLCICQVSNSHLSLSKSNRANIVGCSIFDVPLSTIPVASLPVLLGAIQIAISTKTVLVVDGHLGSPSLTNDAYFCKIQFYKPCLRSTGTQPLNKCHVMLRFSAELQLLDGTTWFI
jgi:hypothetical protein